MPSRTLVAVCLVLALTIPAPAQRPPHGRGKRPARAPTELFRAQGTIEAIGRGMIQIFTDSNQPWMIWIAPQAKIHVVGTAEVDFIQPGMFIRFKAEVDKRSKGRIKEKVDELTIFTPFREPDDAVGLWPEGVGPAAEEEGEDNFAGIADGEAAGRRTAMSQLYTIAGRITDDRRGRLTVNTGKGVFKIELAEEPKVKVDIADYVFAKKGDKISITMGKMYVGQMGRAMASELRIKLSEPLTLPGKKRPSRAKPTTPKRSTSRPGVRKFRFIYGATIDELKPGTKARVWLPVAQSTHEQKVRRGELQVPGEFHETNEEKFDNKILYFEATADDNGQIPVVIEYLVERREVLRQFGEPAEPQGRELFLAATSMVPVNGSLLKELVGAQLPRGERVDLARLIYNAVDARMKYDKPAGQPWGRGDARWACSSGFGNCTDFHSLFIAACRDLRIPAKFEIGFPIPVQKGRGTVGGYHCWAKFLSGGRWVGVDISEADKHPGMKGYYFGNLTADRVMFTTGRDLQLNPPQEASPVNFLVYPYVEVDHKQHRHFVKNFRYEDLE